MVTLPYPVFRRISLWMRIMIILGLLGLLSSSFAIPTVAEHLSQHPHSRC